MAKREKKVYRINGKVIDYITKQGIAGLRVEAWDKDLLIDDLLGVATSDENGSFIITFDERYRNTKGSSLAS